MAQTPAETTTTAAAAAATTQSITIQVPQDTPAATADSTSTAAPVAAAATPTTPAAPPAIPVVVVKTHVSPRHAPVAHHALKRHLPAAVLAPVAKLAPLVLVPNHFAPSTQLSRPATLILPDYVKVVAPTAPGSSDSADGHGRTLKLPLRTPSGPPPLPTTPGSFGSALGGAAGGAILVVAALVGLLMVYPPRFTSRVRTLLATPLAYRRLISLERPG